MSSGRRHAYTSHRAGQTRPAVDGSTQRLSITAALLSKCRLDSNNFGVTTHKGAEACTKVATLEWILWLLVHPGSVVQCRLYSGNAMHAKQKGPKIDGPRLQASTVQTAGQAGHRPTKLWYSTLE